ncbi:VOC family protein [Bacillus sp. EB600]|uniref:VOC family protein n=1 Tax=Bacillus sp. EB600 TaxID=2806345 RepID=UPI00210E31AF|nr:VOC family protein [Bacillus sp. EB600]MCQ6282677.1 VOC family protein [Bacillus sp. EB600]
MIRYKKLGYVVLSVTDLDKSVDFYENIVGMQFVERVDNTAFLRCSGDHHNLILEQGEEPGLKRVAYELEKVDQFQGVFDFLTEQGINSVELSEKECHSLAQGRTLRFKDPYLGVTYEFYVQIMELGKPFVPKNARITRLLHVVYETNKFDELLDFFTNTLGFKVSDIQGRETGWAWLRAFPSPFHHDFALTKGKDNKLNHLAFQAERVDDIGIQVNKLNDNNVPILFGPGKHHPSGSIFLYFADPDGLTIEYSQGMEEFTEENPREPRRLEPTMETLDEWGGRPQPGWGKVGKLITEDHEKFNQ